MILHLEDRDAFISNMPNDYSCFIAHPYMKKDWGDLLVEILSSEGITARSPFIDQDHKHFLKMVLDECSKTNLFIADLSLYNLNVSFEAGIAIGLTKNTLLIVNKNQEPTGVPDILADVIHFKYSDRDEIVSQVVEELLSVPEKKSTIEGMFPYFELGNLNSVTDLAFFPGQEYGDEYKTVRRTLKSLTAGLNCDLSGSSSVMNSSILGYIARLSHSRFNVFRLLDPKDVDANKTNLNTAFMAGLSFGSGKRTLFIIPQSLTDLTADTRRLSLVYSNETDVVTKLGALFTDLMPELVRDKREMIATNHEKLRAKRFVRLKDFRFGDPDAKKDQLLIEAFTEWPIVTDILNGSRNIVIGKRGTGKTALKRVLEERLLDPKTSFWLTIDPLEEELEELYNLDLKPFNVTSIKQCGGTAKRIWTMLLPVYLLNRIDIALHDGLSQPILTLLENYHSEFQEVIGNRSVSFFAASLLNSELTGGDEFGRYTVRIAELHARAVAILDSLSSLHHQGYILIDSLDTRWHTDGIAPMSLVYGLVEAVRYLRDRTKIIPILFLRKDIYETIRRDIIESDKIIPIELTWTKEQLKEMIGKRIRAQREQSSSTQNKQLINIIFENVQGNSAFNRLLHYSLQQPRELIRFATRCWDDVQKDKREKISTEDVERYAKVMSEERLLDLPKEYGHGMKWMEPLVCSMISANGLYTPEDWYDTVSGVIENIHVSDDSGKAVTSVDTKVDQITLELIRLEVLEVLDSGRRKTFPIHTIDALKELLPSTLITAAKPGILTFNRARKIKYGIEYQLSYLYRKAVEPR